MPDTRGPYLAAYIVVAVVYGAYAFSLWLRAKRVRDRLKELAHSGRAPR